ncbi:hypothetical protein [Microbacterium terricola]|uniref:Uncharacterized protein n=1 Tax=Microbacterium terricola TaxID=344163 RepID=A0ABM8E0T3_9MICO|nr:hypothetical protein [Microbacterium terricola]UYK40827.1 hypothetical protein OAU46_04035 [Microbacterium terricola]BDV31425.1 hypothetical protein Microterr_20850 [Microbacterium terricola]
MVKRKRASSEPAAAPPATPPATPGTDAAKEPPEKDAAPIGRAQRWSAATKEARETIKWLATAIGAAAALVFGAGPLLTTTELDIASWPPWRTVVCLVAAVVGVVGVVLVIWSLLKALTPEALTLDQLPPSTVRRLEDSAETSFPGDISSIAQLKQRFGVYRVAIFELGKKEALATTDAERKILGELIAKNRDNLKKLREVEDAILEQGAFELTRSKVTDLLAPVLAGSALAVIGVVAYQLAMSGPTDPPAAAASDQIGRLVDNGSIASTRLWTALDLSACEVDAGSIPVLVSGGSGTSEDPYSVTTIPARTACAVVSFTVTDDVANVVLPEVEKVTVTVTPAPAD